ncbi:MAG: HAD family hydrolase [Pseudomonadota bacterium]
MIRGLLFDKDGTLLDFDATWRGFALEVLEALAPGDPALRARLGEAVGVDAATGAFAPGSPIVAGTSADIAEIWAPMLPGWSVASLTAEADRRALAATARGPAPAAPDLPGLLDRLAAPGRRLGIATHDGEAAARAHMLSLGALDRFDFVAGYDSGHGLKPGPGMVQAFCAAQGLAPQEVAMIGDSLHDLHAGRAAGMRTIGVLTGPALRAELEPAADVVLDHIGEIPGWLDQTA